VGVSKARFVASLPTSGNARTWFQTEVWKNSFGNNWAFEWDTH
jgi:hypothetical protein